MEKRRRRPPAKKNAEAKPDKREKRPAQSRDPARRARILDVAKRHFARAGFKGTNLDAVARDAGCAKGALYLEFPDKQSLIREVIMRSYTEIAARYQAQVASIESPLERIVEALRFSYSETAREPLFSRLLHEDPELFALLPGRLIEEAKQQVTQVEGWVDEAKKRGELRADFDADALPFIMAVLKYAPVHLDVVEQYRMFSKSRALDAILDMVRAGLRAPPASSPRRNR